MRADTPIRPYDAPCGFLPVGADQCIRPQEGKKKHG